MTKVNFLDQTTIKVIALDGEVFTLKTYLPVPKESQKSIAVPLAKYFNENFEDDKSSMIYWVFTKMFAKEGFTFYLEGSDRNKERERIGARIRGLREAKGIEAKQLAILTNIDASNLCRIEQGRYSVGFDILTKISDALGVKVDLV